MRAADEGVAEIVHVDEAVQVFGAGGGQRGAEFLEGVRAEGAYFGWWNFAVKLNLALSAGLALPLLSLTGYTPGTSDPQGMLALTLAYCALPCALKLLAGGALYALVIRPSNPPATAQTPPPLLRKPS